MSFLGILSLLSDLEQSSHCHQWSLCKTLVAETALKDQRRCWKEEGAGLGEEGNFLSCSSLPSISLLFDQFLIK